MKARYTYICMVAASALLLACVCGAAAADKAAAVPPGFTSLFDGTTLNGWRGSESIWSVHDGAITGGSDQPIPGNTFLIYERPYGNFELHYKYRMDGDGNSGFQFRSIVSDESKYAVKGVQANVVPTDQAERFGMLWEEGGRGELALLGHKMVISRDNGKVVKNVLASTNSRELLFSKVRPYPQWNDVVVIAYGNHLVHALNGYLLFDAVDNDPNARTEGIFALQAHSGPPMHVQFKDIVVKPLTSEPDLTGRFISNPGPPTPANPGPRVPRKGQAESKPSGEKPAGFTAIFDGRTLDGWHGDPGFFTVRDGAIVAGSQQNDTPKNTYLILDKPHADFELHYKYRWVTQDGNSGIQFRSGLADGHFALAGMQANLTPIIPQTERFGMLYEELGDRAEMVLLGQKAVITRQAAGRGGRGRIVRTVLATTNPREKILAAIRPYPQWNDVVLIACGDRIIHAINGLLVFDATDKDPLGRKDGLIGIQVHAGKPMVVELKDMALKPLVNLPDLSRFATQPGAAPEPTRTFKDSTKVAMPDEALPPEVAAAK